MLYAPAALPRLLEAIQTLHTNISRYLVLYLAGLDYQQISQREHHQILDACRYGNVELAITCLENHLRFAANQLVAFLKA